jgi:hypothetical protein
MIANSPALKRREKQRKDSSPRGTTEIILRIAHRSDTFHLAVSPILIHTGKESPPRAF